MTRKSTIVVSDLDRKRLESLIHDYRRNGLESWSNLTALEQELSKAVTVPPSEIPADVVTMNSTVRLRVRGGGTPTYTIVYPIDANLDEDRISVLAPLATAVFGYRVGDRVDWNLPSGPKEIVIDEILYQPEAAGDYRR